MKKYIKLSLISVLCVSLLMTNVISADQSPQLSLSHNTIVPEVKIAPNQFGEEINYSRPILDKVTYQINDSTPELDMITLVQRNDTENIGGVFQSVIYSNVTIYYKVLNGTENTNVYLHTNEPTLDSGFDVNNNSVVKLEYVSSVNVTDFELPYSGEVLNGSLATYMIKFNVTQEYVNFFARAESLPENLDGAPMNLLSAGQYFTATFNEDFYIQKENVTITLSANNATSDDVYGIKYKTNKESLYTNMNFTSSLNGSVANGTIYLGFFEPGITIEIMPYAYLKDVTNNETVRVTNIFSQSVEVGDGTPSLSLDILDGDDDNATSLRQVSDIVYSRSRVITLNFNASVIKGDVVRYAVNYSDGVSPVFKDNIAFTEVNGTHIVQDNFTTTADGQWNVTVFAFTDKGLSVNQTFSLYIDTVKPTMSFVGPEQGAKITGETLEVTFEFNFEDELSGVYYASLDMDDGNVIEVTGMESLTYVYLEDGTYSLTLTVVDKAGNYDFIFLTITVEKTGITEAFAPLSTISFFAALIALPIIVRRK